MGAAKSEDVISVRVGDDGIAIATMDLPGRPMNVVNDVLMGALQQVVERLRSDAGLRGLVLTSAKADFCAGGDLDRIARFTSAAEVFAASEAMKSVLRHLETAGKPVVAAINGHALGGGLEIALACHARFALDSPKLKLGQPEVKLGLLPGGGGCLRLPRLIGIQPALEVLGQGEDIAPAKAQRMGLLQGLAPDREALLAQARAWCLANPKAKAPWDAPGWRFPGGDSKHPAVAQLWAIAPSVANAKTGGNYPAVGLIMSAVFEGGLLGFDAASQVESRCFAAAATSQVCRNMVNTLWFQLNAIKKGASRPQAQPQRKIQRLGVLGAGMMGAGIAYVAAKAGIEVVLLDTTLEAAQRGKAYSQGLLDKAVQKGRRTAAQREELLARIRPGTDFAALAGCELVIEAVFEDRAVKAEVTRRAEGVLAADAVFASNTSTLPISGLAQASARPAQFIGLHFFSPVDKMPLVEIICGQATDNATLALAFDFVLQIGKTPIVVNDSRGFFTSRVFGTYVMEGAALVAEGVHPRSIEAAGLAAGMPMPPLALQDEVSLSLAVHVADQTKLDLAAEGKSYTEHPGMAVLRELVAAGRVGKKAGQGFYDWPAAGEKAGAKGGDKRLWPGLMQAYALAPQQPTQEELIERLMLAQVNEAVRCLEEGVLRSVADANIGSIFGWGFAPFEGGVLQYVNARGAAAVVHRLEQLAAKHGARYAPARHLREMAATGARFEAAVGG
jgi:3-hydroxyacyl-CoA dehydrogenase / enoyl-CoA hydratase / 3-hydroxybutyryl-CoA epimerase